MADTLLTKTLARQIKHQINAGTEAAPIWYDINGLTGMTGSGSKTDADTTTADEDGVESHLPASRGKSFSLTGLRGYVNLSTGVRDPGQVAVEEAAELIGPSGLKQFRRILPDGVGTCQTMLASFNISSDGGSLNDANAWSVDVTRSGPTTTVELGAVPDTPTSVIGTAGVLQVSVAYVVDSSPAPDYAEVFIYDAATDEEVAYGKDDPATTPLVVTGLLAQPYYARVRAVSTTGSISPLSAPSATFTPTAS
jgi:hypothetical protein